MACARRWPSRAPPASTGVVLHKLDGSARGGVPWPVPRGTGLPSRFVCAVRKAIGDLRAPFQPSFSNSLKRAGDLSHQGEIAAASRAPNKPC